MNRIIKIVSDSFHTQKKAPRERNNHEILKIFAQTITFMQPINADLIRVEFFLTCC